MPSVHRPGTKLPDTHGVVKGGLAVELHDPGEIDGLKAVCMWAPKPPDHPLAAVYRALHDPSLDLGQWADHWRDQPQANAILPAIPPPNAPAIDVGEEKEDQFPRSHIGKLLAALDVAEELWRAQGTEKPLLSLLLLLASPEHADEGGLALDGDAAALVIRPGSLIADVVRLPLRVASFAVCLVVGGGTSTSARRAEMVQRLRTDAGADNNVPPLTDIRDLVLPPAGNVRPLVVLVHGLFATDVGTFKGLQTRLQQRFDVAGFPHDTLSQSIDANAFELAGLLNSLGRTDVRIVAHSRGGLVARSAAARLSKIPPPNNKVRISHLATFGTPHLGAEMAENPGSLIATIAMLKAAAGDRSVASLLDMLTCVAELGHFPGIRDLRPASTNDTWLSQLQAQEGLHPDPGMKIFAVGGAAPAATLMQRIARSATRRVVGGAANDLVVAQSSSLPGHWKAQWKRQAVNSDHFSYFLDHHAKTFDEVVTFLGQA